MAEANQQVDGLTGQIDDYATKLQDSRDETKECVSEVSGLEKEKNELSSQITQLTFKCTMDEESTLSDTLMDGCPE